MQLVSLLLFISLHMTLSTLREFMALLFLHLILICILAICKISPNQSLPRCPHVISPN
jgi:hypothetical protein